MIEINKFRHVAIVVKDIEEMIRFYTEILGFAVKRRMELDSPEFREGVGVKDAKARGAHLTLTNDDFELELIEFEENVSEQVAACSNKTGYRYMAFIVDDIEHVFKTLKQYKIESISNEPICLKKPLQVAGFQFVYVKDPEGNIIEFNQLPKHAI
jgi:glyoxylase I family protein